MLSGHDPIQSFRLSLIKFLIENMITFICWVALKSAYIMLDVGPDDGRFGGRRGIYFL